MNIETPDELAEFLANVLSVYGAHDEECEMGVRRCRCCFVTAMTQRIRDAVRNEERIHRLFEGGVYKTEPREPFMWRPLPAPLTGRES